MNEIHLENLPEGAVVHGTIYDDPDAVYRCEHIVDIFMPNGAKVAIKWNGLDHKYPFDVEAKYSGGGAYTSRDTPGKAAEIAIFWANEYGALS